MATTWQSLSCLQLESMLQLHKHLLTYERRTVVSEVRMVKG